MLFGLLEIEDWGHLLASGSEAPHVWWLWAGMPFRQCSKRPSGGREGKRTPPLALSPTYEKGCLHPPHYDLCVRFLTSAANLAVGGGDGLVYTSRQAAKSLGGSRTIAVTWGWVSLSDADGLGVPERPRLR